VLAPETQEAIAQVLTDRRLAKARPKFFNGSISEATRQFEGNASPDLLIIETRENPRAIFEQLEGLAAVCRMETQLILVGTSNDVGLYRSLTKAGIRDYVPLPIDPAHLLDSLVAVCADPEEVRQARLISCIGASGGAGSTTIANNLAWGLGKLYDGEVTLIDLDLVFGTTALDFNLESPENSAQALAQADRIDDQVLARIIGKYNENLALLTAPDDCNRNGDIDPAALENMLKALRRNAAWVVADLPHYWCPWVRAVLDASNEIVLTAVPSLSSLRNAKNVADTLNARRKNDTPVRVVLNRIGQNSKTDISTKDFAATLGSALAVSVPYEPAIFAEAANTGHMIGETPRGQRVLEPMNTLATLVSGRQGTEKRAAATKVGLLQRLLPRAAAKTGARARA
jgi:pilus assembly protein CpaE